MICYRLYVYYFETTYPYTTPPTYEEWAINMFVKIETDSQARSFLKFSGEKYCEKKVCFYNRTMVKKKAGILVKTQATLHMKFGTFRHLKISRFSLYLFSI